MSHINTIKQKLMPCKPITSLLRWIWRTNNNAPLAIGLDLNPDYIALIELQRTANNHYELINYTFTPINETEAINKNHINKTILDFINKGKPKSKKIATALPYQQCHYKTIEINRDILKTTDIESFLRLNSEHLLGIDIDNYYFDYYLNSEIAENSSNATVNFFSASKEVTDKYISVISNSQFQLEIIDIDVYALLRAALLLYPEMTEPYIIIKLENKKLSFLVVSNKQIENIHETEAPVFQQDTETTAQYILQQLENLNSIDHAILLCGFNATLELAQALTNKNRRSVILANPLQQMTLAPRLKQYRDHLQKNAPALMSSYGLALHGANNSNA